MEFGNIRRSHVLLVLLLVGQRFCIDYQNVREWREAIRATREKLGVAIQDLAELPSLRLGGRASGTMEEARMNEALLNTLNQTLRVLDDQIVNFGLDTLGGGMYFRWGRRDCPQDTELLYKGVAGGGHSAHPGAGANYLCLPETPDYLSTDWPVVNNMIYASKYATYNFHIPGINAKQVPCALCRSTHRRSAFMIPGWTDCNNRSVKSIPWFFHQEYNGYLMSGQWNDFASSMYVCVDSQAEAIDVSMENTYPKMFLFTVTRCGALGCPPYVEGKEVPCVVCTM